jgi:hypothetical protein
VGKLREAARSSPENAFPCMHIPSSALVRIDGFFYWKAKKSPNKHPLDLQVAHFVFFSFVDCYTWQFIVRK